jgi:hypothetical protein
LLSEYKIAKNMPANGYAFFLAQLSRVEPYLLRNSERRGEAIDRIEWWGIFSLKGRMGKFSPLQKIVNAK